MMYILGILGTGMVIVGVVMMLSSDNSPKKSWRPKKKNFFVRLGETGDPVHFSK